MMNTSFLSCELSALENARLLAEYNIQSTKNFDLIQTKIKDFPYDETRVKYLAVVVGLIGLGIFIAYTTSLPVGGVIFFAASIPYGYVHANRAKFEDLENELRDEVEVNVQFIFRQITLLFVDAIMAKRKDLIESWNNGQSEDFADTTKEQVKQIARQNYIEILEKHDENKSFNFKYNSEDVKVTYETLKRYARSIALNLPKNDDSEPENIIEFLQKICEVFDKKCAPKMKKSTIDDDELKDLEKTKIRSFRQFQFSTESDQKVILFFLDNKIPKICKPFVLDQNHLN